MTDELHLTEFQAHLLGEDRARFTILGYLGDVSLFARWYETHYKEPLTPERFTNESVRSYKQYLLSRNAMPKTVNRRLASLAAYAHWLIHAEYAASARNPVSGVRSIQEEPLAPRWLTKKERAAYLRSLEKLVEEAARKYPRQRLQFLRDAAIVKLCLYAGLRVSEIIQLHLLDVILDERKGLVIVREGKGSKRREVPLNAKARKALLDYLEVRPNIDNEFLFISQRNEGVQDKTVQRAVERFVKGTDLKDVSAHVLRHTFAKTLIDSGVSLEKVATLLGHSNLNTTRIYTTPGIQDLEEAVEGVE